MAQGTRVTRNLFYGNSTDDILMEVDHGPYLIDNNLLMSGCSIRDVSEAGAFAQNLIAGLVDDTPDTSRLTPFLRAHSTQVAGLSRTKGGDDRYYNNLFVEPSATIRTNEAPPRFAGYGLWVYNTREYQLQTGGNAYYNGARPYSREYGSAVITADNPHLELIEDGEDVFIQMTLGNAIQGSKTSLVTTERLGLTKVSGLPYENPEGSPLKIDRDYFDSPRSPSNPGVGPFANSNPGTTRFRVW